MADQRPAAIQRLVHLRRRCVRRACSVETALPSALALRSTDSAADLSALFAGFIATMARSDFSPPYIAGVHILRKQKNATVLMAEVRAVNTSKWLVQIDSVSIP